MRFLPSELRVWALVMARRNNTPAPFFIDMPLAEFARWRDASDEIDAAIAEARERARRKR